MKPYSPLRRWLREERAREHAAFGAWATFEVDCRPEQLREPGLLFARRGPRNLRADAIYGEGVGMLFARAGLIP